MAETDIRPGQSLELLKALHILTRDGKMNQDSRRKLKQVYHLFQFIEPLLRQRQQSDQPDRFPIECESGQFSQQHRASQRFFSNADRFRRSAAREYCRHWHRRCRR